MSNSQAQLAAPNVVSSNPAAARKIGLAQRPRGVFCTPCNPIRTLMGQVVSGHINRKDHIGQKHHFSAGVFLKKKVSHKKKTI